MPEENAEVIVTPAVTETDATNEVTEPKGPEGEPNAESTDPAAPADADDAEAEDGVTDDMAPEVARKIVDKERKRAASYRTQLREAEAALKALEGAKSLEEFQKAQADWSSQLEQSRKEAHELLVENIVKTYDVPEDLVEFLTGETREELIAKAEKLANHGGTAGTNAGGDPDGGLSPQSGAPGRQSPGELASKYGRRHL